MAESEHHWDIIIAKQPEKALRRLPQDIFRQINRTILTLAQNPRPPESQKLAGYDNLYRLRLDLGGWHIIYAVEEKRLIVLILEIAPKQQPERYQLEEPFEGAPQIPSISKLEKQGLEFSGDAILDTRPLVDIHGPSDEDLTRIEDELREKEPLADSATEAEEIALVKQIQRGLEAQEKLETAQDLNDDENEALEEQVAEGNEAKGRLTKAKAGLVIKTVEPFIGRSLMSYLNLIHQGHLGLLRAAETFDPQRKYQFSIYATWWIRQAIDRAIDQAGAIYLPADMVETINKWIHTERRLAKEYGRDPSPEEIALEMDLLSDEDVQTIREAMKYEIPLDPIVERRWRQAAAIVRHVMRITLEPLSLSAPVAPGSKKQLLKEQLREILPSLSERERKVLEMRFGLTDGQERTLEEVSSEFGVTRERIRQIVGKAFRQLSHSPPEKRTEKIRVKIITNDPEIRENLVEILVAEPDVEMVAKIHQADIILTVANMAHEITPQDTFTQEVIMVRVQDQVNYQESPILYGARDVVGMPISSDKLMSTIRRVYNMAADETAMKAAAQSLRTYNLGMFVEISLSVADLPESIAFYEKLGLKKVEGGEEPHPWAVLSDERLLLGLYQKPFPSPMLNYFDWSELSARIDFLKTLNITFDHMQTLGVPITPRQNNFVLAAEFEAFEGQRVRLTHLWSEKTNPGRNFFARCDKFGELSLKTADVDAAVTYWKQLGFHRIAGDDRPYPWATLTDGTIRLGLHQTSKFTKPTISYFAPDMPDRLKQLRQAGLDFLSEHKDAEGQSVGAVVQSPDGQPFFLFTGQVASLN